MKLKRHLIVAAVLAQLAVLGWMAAEREWVVRNGSTVYLRTAPVDPRDPMRGDYVRLSYEIAIVPKALCRDGIVQWFSAEEDIYNSRVRDRRVFAEVRLDDEGVAELVSLSDQEPAEGLYLRGRATAIHLSTIEIRLGAEAFFMQQGKAREFENQVIGEKAGVPLNMEVGVGGNGLVVLKGYRWEPLGLTLNLDRNPEENPPTANRRAGLRGLTVELKNHGSRPQAIVHSSRTPALRLVPALERWRTAEQAGWSWVGENLPAVKPRVADVKVLAPGESYRVHLDLTLPEWFVQKQAEGEEPAPAVALESLAEDWTASFRIEYVPPSAAESTGWPDEELIRHSRLRSRQFSASGGGD